MQPTFKRTFRIRTYECDPYNNLALLNYLRFMQETAIDASAQVGYDGEKYAQIHRLWLIRETGLEIYAPLRANDRVEIETWVADFRRVSSRRIYQFSKSGVSDLAVSAYSDWVFIDSDSGQPAPIPSEMVNAFFPTGTDPRPPRSTASPPAPNAPDEIFRTTHQVTWRDLDALMHVNNANYLTFAEECHTKVLAFYGWSITQLRAANASLQVRRARIQYLQPAVLGDLLEITSWMYLVNPFQFGRHFNIARLQDQLPLVKIDLIFNWIDLSSGAAVAIPAQFREDLSANSSQELHP